METPRQRPLEKDQDPPQRTRGCQTLGKADPKLNDSKTTSTPPVKANKAKEKQTRFTSFAVVSPTLEEAGEGHLLGVMDQVAWVQVSAPSLSNCVIWKSPTFPVPLFCRLSNGDDGSARLMDCPED